MQTLWLYLYFPQLQLDLLPDCSANDAITAVAEANQPLVLLHSQDLRVHQANQAAQQLGIQPGQSLAQACALCASLQVLPWQAELEQQMLEMLAQDCYQLCADLALAPPDALWLRLDPMLQLYGGLPAFLQQLKQRLQQRPQLQFRYAAAVTAEAARLLCLSQPGLLVTTQQTQQLALQQCPVTLLNLPPAVLQQLQRLGIRQLGAMLALPVAELSRRFGAELSLYLQQLRGQLPPPLRYYQPPETFSAQLELWYQIEHHPQLLAPLRHLLLRLQQYLQCRELRCYQLQLELTLRDCPPLSLKLHSPQAEARAERWLTLWQLKLEALKLPAPVIAMQLIAAQYCPRTQDSVDLYAGKQGQYTPLQLIGLLQAKLGVTQVCRPCEQAAFLPELAGSTMVLQQPELSQPERSGNAPHTVQQNTAVYQSHPAAASVGQTESGAGKHRPAFLFTSPQPLQQQVQLLPGLERIQSHWWQGQAGARDYLTARSTDGRWLWVYRNEQQQWFVHGVFA